VHVAQSYRFDPPRAIAVRSLESAEEMAALEPEWRVLEQSLPAVPFNRFDWALSWWRAFGPTTFRRRSQLRVLEFRCADQLVGIAPMMLTSWPAHGPLRASTLQFFGNDPNLTELRGPAFHPAFEAEGLAALFNELRARLGTWDWLRLSGLPVHGDLGALEAAPLSRTAERETPSYVLELPESWSALKARLSRNTKEAIRKCYNAPKRAGVALGFEVVTGGPALSSALTEFLRLHAGRAERRGTVPHANAFARAEAMQFLECVCTAFAGDGRLRVFQLRARGEVVATRIAFALGDTLYLYYSGYANELAQYSVMTRLVCEVLEYAIGNGFRRVNLSTGTDASKLRWGPTKTVHRDVELVSDAFPSRLLHGAFTWTSRTVNNELLPRLRAFQERRTRALRGRGVAAPPHEVATAARGEHEDAPVIEDERARGSVSSDQPPQSGEIAAQ